MCISILNQKFSFWKVLLLVLRHAIYSWYSLATDIVYSENSLNVANMIATVIYKTIKINGHIQDQFLSDIQLFLFILISYIAWVKLL